MHLIVSRPPQVQQQEQPQVNAQPNPVNFHNMPNQPQQQPEILNPNPNPNNVPQHNQPPPNQENQGGEQALLIKLVILVFILTQGGGTLRAVLLVFGAFILYLYLTGRFRIQINHYAPPRPRNQENGNAEGEEQAPPQPVDRGIVGEISDIVIPFISSLAPTWNPYEMNVQHQHQHQHQNNNQNNQNNQNNNQNQNAQQGHAPGL